MVNRNDFLEQVRIITTSCLTGNINGSIAFAFDVDTMFLRNSGRLFLGMFPWIDFLLVVSRFGTCSSYCRFPMLWLAHRKSYSWLKGFPTSVRACVKFFASLRKWFQKRRCLRSVSFLLVVPSQSCKTEQMCAFLLTADVKVSPWERIPDTHRWQGKDQHGMFDLHVGISSPHFSERSFLFFPGYW